MEIALEHRINISVQADGIPDELATSAKSAEYKEVLEKSLRSIKRATGSYPAVGTDIVPFFPNKGGMNFQVTDIWYEVYGMNDGSEDEVHVHFFLECDG